MPDTGPEAGAEGAVEKLKGAAKEVVGNVTGSDELAAEGEAQQKKAAAETDIAEHEAKAEAARAKAEAHEAEELSHQ